MPELNDKDLINDIVTATQFLDGLKQEILKHSSSSKLGKNALYPLDEETINLLIDIRDKGMQSTEKDLPYSKVNELNSFWQSMIVKAIQCLRFFDSREPFKDSTSKTIVVYGMENLTKYYDSYTEFEGLLYGSNANYRDHIFHIFRTWLLGLYVIIKKNFDVSDLDGLKNGWSEYGELTTCEKISMWTIIAFCHDLGYPLEKAKGILHATQDMMQEIVTDSKITADFSFVGTQLSINEYIVKFISTKMKKISGDKHEKSIYCGRIQPKYYLKLSKSLEGFHHGILSSITIYKTLLYFLESDFNLNDDYQYSPEDARQFYIRREILRAIGAHTCFDIYNIKVTTFSSLLYLCDEMQNWGRKDWHDLYFATDSNKIELEIETFTDKSICYKEIINIGEKEDLKKFVNNIFVNQYSKYKKKFRDGQDSSSRKFNIQNNIKVIQDITGTEKPTVEISIKINGNNKPDKFEYKTNHFELNKDEFTKTVFYGEIVKKNRKSTKTD